MGFLTIKPPAIEPVTVAQLITYGHLDPNEDQSLLAMLIASAREWCEEFTKRAFIFQTKRLLFDFFPGAIDPALSGQTISSPFVVGSNPVMVGIQYAILLPWPLVREVAALRYQDANGETVTMEPGVDFRADLDSQPARLTPLFDNYWPVTQVITNAISVDYVTGYAGPVTVSVDEGSTALVSPFNFLARDLGAPISIPNAAAGGKTPLDTTIAAVDADGHATLANPAEAAVANQTTVFGAVPPSIQQAILALASARYEMRLPGSDSNGNQDGIKNLLWPYRDLRL